MSSHEALRKRVETILDMAVSTVSSLTESFMSDIPLGGDDAVLSKEKEKTPQDAITTDAEKMTSGSGQILEDGKDEDSDLTEQSDDDGGMLEVHD